MTAACVAGTFSSAGSDTATATCTASDGSTNYVNAVCTAGDHANTGSDSIIASCMGGVSIGAQEYIDSPCVAGKFGW